MDRKRFWLLTTGLVMLTLSGCGGGGGGSISDTPPSIVRSVSPADGETGVARNTTITATFNEDIYAISVDGSSFTLSGNSAVGGTVDFNGATNVATFTPDSELAMAATYTATLTTGITDLYGNALASDYSWSFTTADGSWGTTEIIENSANHVYTPTVAFDNNGNAFVLWTQSDGNALSVWANRYEPGSGWGTAELIESNAGNADRADIAFDDAGNAIAVWPQHDGTRFNMWANRYVLGSGWQTAEKIETDDSGTAHSPKVDFDGSGNALVVWHQTDGVRYNIMANRYVSGSGWGTVEIIDSEDLGDALFPTIAVSDTGDAIAVWEQYDGVRYNIWRNHYTSGSGWQTAEKLESDDVTYARYPQIGTDGDGNAIVVWNQGTDIMASHYQSGSGWSTPALIETESSTFYYPHIAMNSSGKAVVVWYDSGTTYSIWANSYNPDSGWGTAQRIENDGVNLNYDPRVAIDEEGNAIAVWQLDGSGEYSIMSNRYTVNGGWGTAETIEAISAECYEPTVAIDSSSGKGIAVWYDYDTSHDLFVNRFE